jgi:hypothetical protein
MLLPATFAFVPMQRARSTLWRILLIPFAFGLGLMGYLLSKPLGPWLQRHVTTEADLGDLRVTEILAVRKGVHRVMTK